MAVRRRTDPKCDRVGKSTGPEVGKASGGREILVRERDLQSRVRDPLQKQVSWARPLPPGTTPFSSKSTVIAMRRGR